MELGLGMWYGLAWVGCVQKMCFGVGIPRVYGILYMHMVWVVHQGQAIFNVQSLTTRQDDW